MTLSLLSQLFTMLGVKYVVFSTIFFRLLFECQQAVLKMNVSNWIPNHMSHTQPSTKRKTAAIKFTTAQIQSVKIEMGSLNASVVLGHVQIDNKRWLCHSSFLKQISKSCSDFSRCLGPHYC